jgi:hypothetical protein
MKNDRHSEASVDRETVKALLDCPNECPSQQIDELIGVRFEHFMSDHNGSLVGSASLLVSLTGSAFFPVAFALAFADDLERLLLWLILDELNN